MARSLAAGSGWQMGASVKALSEESPEWDHPGRAQSDASSPSILGHIRRPSLYPLRKKVLSTNLKGLHPFCYQGGPGARGPDVACHLFFYMACE